MASFKAEKPVGTQCIGGPVKKEAGKAGSDGTSKTAASKSAPKRAAPKPLEPKKKGKGGKSAKALTKPKS